MLEQYEPRATNAKKRGEAIIPQEGGEDEAGHGLSAEVEEVAIAHTHRLQPHDTQQRAKQRVGHLQQDAAIGCFIIIIDL